jgi:acetyltransferase-like isoleucine patch superfamily enzyme
MKNKLVKYWNLKPQGVVKFGMILLNVSVLSAYEKISSFFWKYNLGRAGNNLTIQKGTSIRYPHNLSLGNNVSIGRNCQVSSEFSDSYLRINKNTNIDKKCLIDYSGGIEMGENVTISEGVMIETHSHGFNPRSKPVKMPIKISNNVWIGARATILPNVEYIGENAIIGAGSIVTKSVEKNEIVAGNPAKCIRYVN